MYLRLRELEIYGFKSFGEKAFLIFPSNLNVILGPNGSGKSNVVDGLRWVLGDQSFRNLRISEAEDLLFIGSKSSNIAWVRIGLESGDVSYEIQRKVQKNGESEYLFNNETVRLKDIQKFLAENQIGTKGFTIVNQGSADLFIKASPEERYIMLSEILGIRALEIKKFETKKNLEHTKERLKIAKMKLRALEPQAEIFLIEKQKRERKTEIEKKLDEFFILIRGKRKFLLKERTEALSNEIKEAVKNREQAEKDLEKFSEDIQRGSLHNQLSDLRKLESELWKDRSVILEKGLSEKVSPVGSKKQGVISFVIEKLNYALGIENIKEIKKLINEVLQFIKPVDKNKTEEKISSEIQIAIQKIDKKISDIKAKIIEEEKNEKDEKEKINIKLEKFKEAQNKIFEFKHLEDKLIEEEKSVIITLNELKSAKEEESTREELSVLINEEEQLQSEILRLGDINEEIIFKGDKIIKNLDVLKKETIELEESYAKLYKLLIEYQEKIKSTFDGGIKKINQSLVEYFYKLYGGTAKLTLKDENKSGASNVLSIHITIDHPQKKVKVLEALSGGEKALFSISLIFAIIKISEPPFLILDEIDAALDEQNSYKFAEFLKELSQKTQFIIVSHNRSTIESAEILFGISLQNGISKVFSLKLKEALETIEK